MAQASDGDAVQAALELAAQMESALVDEVTRVATIPAPTFEEHRRAEYVKEQFTAAGISDVAKDEISNTWGIIPGESRSRALLLTAHMDTVFGHDVETMPRLDGDILRGPGVRDNSAAVAALIQLARLLGGGKWRPAVDVIVAGTVREEGKGNLEGISSLLPSFGDRVRGVLVIDGPLGNVINVCVGSRRLKVSFSCEGGHSWQDHGRSSAVHLMGEVIHDLTSLPLCESPKTTLNVGTVRGGTGVNVIAQNAGMTIDLRSTDPTQLSALERSVRKVIDERATSAGCKRQIEVIGERPPGGVPSDHAFVTNACEVLQALEVPARLEEGSTEANVPVSRGIPAIAIGASSGSGVHTVQEYLRVPSLLLGLKQVIMMTDRLSKVVAEA